MTSDERQFINEQGIPMDLLFDADGQPINHIKSEMKLAGKIFAFNTTPCKQFGHTIRTRAGHCIQCDTSKIAYMFRHVLPGTVYIAGSIKGQMIKIGTTNNIEKRSVSLNQTKYGGLDDWKILLNFQCMDSGSLEFEVHKHLRPFEATDIEYEHEKRNQESSELFRCNYLRAKKALLKAGEDLKIEIVGVREQNSLLDRYNFKTLRKL